MRSLMTVVALLSGVAIVDTAPAEEPKVSVRVYSVADLVAQPPGADTQSMQFLMQLYAASNDAPIPLPESKDESAENLQELTELLQEIAAPEQWESVGGVGRIAAHSKTLSLVVRQTEEGHREVSDVLEQLRRENSVRVELTLEFLEESSEVSRTPAPSPAPASTAVYPSSPIQPAAAENSAPIIRDSPLVRNQIASAQVNSKPATPAATLKDIVGDFVEKYGRTMDSEELKLFRAAIRNSAKTAHVSNSRLANGRSRFILFGFAQSVISADRRFVDVNISHPTSPTFASNVRLPDGESAVLRLMDEDADGITVIVTAKIHVPEEEEELVTPTVN